MDIRSLSPDYAVAPQLQPADLPGVREAGFATLICNRPDEEVGPELSSDEMRRAAEDSGLRFVLNPVRNGALTDAEVARQAEARAASDGPVLAYCRSGTRSAVVWALGEAGSGDPDAILAAAAEAGYGLDGLRPELEARSRGSK